MFNTQNQLVMSTKKVLVVDTENHKVMETSLTFEEIRMAEQALAEAKEVTEGVKNLINTFDENLNSLKADKDNYARIMKVRLSLNKAGFSENAVKEVDAKLAKAFEFVSTQCGRTFDEYAEDLKSNQDAQLSLMMSVEMFAED